mmetsp:Transcript_15425/g.24667  ORF Transcript_15425/g.24667 Transcript_15425/m.24667 type:complete len:278 (+) Transcript_15425:147-980(+)
MLGPTKKQKLEQMVEDMKEQENITELRRYLNEKKKFSINDFTVKQTIGHGTFGTVDLASIEFQGERVPVVVKTLPKSEICRLKQEEHVLSEKKCLYTMSHEFIVKLLYAFQDQTKLYFIMEYVAGGDFFSYIRRKGRIKYEAARFYAAQITIALSYVHSKGFVYRGLKPENVLLTKGGHIKLADFGFSKKLQTNKVVLTLAESLHPQEETCFCRLHKHEINAKYSLSCGASSYYAIIAATCYHINKCQRLSLCISAYIYTMRDSGIPCSRNSSQPWT